jgi:hypothetical protein
MRAYKPQPGDAPPAAAKPAASAPLAAPKAVSSSQPIPRGSIGTNPAIAAAKPSLPWAPIAVLGGLALTAVALLLVLLLR